MTRFRNIVCKRLPASTLLETVTASVVFMIVFAMAMDTLTRLLTSDSNKTDFIVIENDLNQCRRQINQSELQSGGGTYPYEWGEIQVEISNYKANIYQVDMIATSKNKYRQISYRFLQANP